MTDDTRKLMALGVAVAAAMTALVLLIPNVLGAAAGPEVEIVTALKEAEARGFELPVAGLKKLVSSKVSYQRISVVLQGDERATVTATLDFDGRFGDTLVSSLGHEKVPFKRDGSEWVAEQGLAPQLVAIVRTMERRRAALEGGDVSLLCSGRSDGGESPELANVFAVSQRKVTARSWLIRSERDEVLVSEDWKVSGNLPERPVDDIGTRRLSLQPSGPSEFCFPDGLM